MSDESDCRPALSAVRKAEQETNIHHWKQLLEVPDSATLTRARLNLSQHAQLRSCWSGNGAVCLVTGGVLILEALLDDGRRQVLNFRYPGDLVPSALRRVVTGVNVVAASDAELVDLAQLENSAASELARNVIIAAKKVERERATLQNLVLGRLNSEERLASFLLEIALRGGRRIAERISFPFPMSRDDIADYLCLNPDTVSRILSRLRKQGIYELAGAGQAYTTNIRTICDMTPLTKALIHCYGTPESASWSNELAA